MSKADHNTSSFTPGMTCARLGWILILSAMLGLFVLLLESRETNKSNRPAGSVLNTSHKHESWEHQPECHNQPPVKHHDDKFQCSSWYGPDTQLFHQWMHALPEIGSERHYGTLLSIASFLVTQDLSRSRLILWVNQLNGTIVHSYLPPSMKAYVEIQKFSYPEHIQGSILETNSYFNRSVYDLYKSMGDNKYVTFSDICRILLVARYGGCWMDTDAVLVRSFQYFFDFKIQFGPKFKHGYFNLHILCLSKGSSLAQRAIESIALFPFNQQLSWPTQPISRLKYWVYNDGLSRYLWEHNPRETSENYLNAFPMRFFDPYWAGGAVKIINNAPDKLPLYAQQIATKFSKSGDAYVIHSRYPKSPHFGNFSIIDLLKKRLESITLPHGKCYRISDLSKDCFRVEPEMLLEDDVIMEHLHRNASLNIPFTAASHAKPEQECLVHQWRLALPSKNTLEHKMLLWNLASFVRSHHSSAACMMILWVSEWKEQEQRAYFPPQISARVQVRLWNYMEEIKTSPLASSEFFHTNESELIQYLGFHRLQVYSGLVRYLILARYGGCWVDDTVIFLRSFHEIIDSGVQFCPVRLVDDSFECFVMCLRQGSKLAQRALAAMALFPYDNPSGWPLHPASNHSRMVFVDALPKFLWMQQVQANATATDDTDDKDESIISKVSMEYFDPYSNLGPNGLDQMYFNATLASIMTKSAASSLGISYTFRLPPNWFKQELEPGSFLALSLKRLDDMRCGILEANQSLFSASDILEYMNRNDNLDRVQCPDRWYFQYELEHEV